MTRHLKHTVSREPIDVEMGGENFTAYPILSATTLGDLLDKQNSIAAIDPTGNEREALKKIQTVLAEIFDLVLEPESAKRVRERLFSTTEPFDLQREVTPTVTDLVEEYTARPTQPSSPSSNGSNGAGTNSTDGALPALSTPLALTPAAS